MALSEIDPKFAKHLRMVAKAIRRANVVPVLGAGANLCDRQPKEPWSPGKNLPNGSELSCKLAKDYDCEVFDKSDLVRVSQWIGLSNGTGELYEELRKVFAREYEIPSLHRLLAELPAMIGAAPGQGPAELIVTTNYDDLMERALRAARPRVEYDLVRYVAQGPSTGLFVHEPPDGEEVVITTPNTYTAVDPDRRTVVLKIHGTVDRDDRHEDSYVITEDHYIEYLTRTNPSELFPVHVLAKLLNSNFLFLGYGMRDWNLRVILHRIIEERRGLTWKSWAVQDVVDELDEELWRTRDVTLQQHRLSDYATGLRAALEQAAREDAAEDVVA
jgi:hypothetical protein